MPDAASAIRFGPSGRFELQPAERRLLVDGRAAALGARALDLLEALARRPGRLVGKSELLDLVWARLVVEESNLHVQISQLRKLLGNGVIETVPGRGYRFVAAIVEAPTGDAASPPAPAPVAAAAPPPASPRLHGRADDLARLAAGLAPGRCTTLVGPSGVGKTSLARAAVQQGTGPVAWVDLAGLVQGRQVAEALARALGLELDDTAPDPAVPLRRALAEGARLVVLDNAEHLVEACADLVARLADGSPAAFLVTSQVPLAIAAERVQRLGPLALDTTGDPGDGDSDDAFGLLVQRIVAQDHRFAVTDANRPVLHAICAQLDGLPLALEMAAARVPALGATGVRDALARRFALLSRGRHDAPERHRTLHRALDWSYRLLDAGEQRVFRSLGVFAGGFTLPLAVAVAAGDAPDGEGHDAHDRRWAAVDALSVLVDRSLVVAGDGEPPRYRLLETLRAFALEQLAQAVSPEPEEPAARRRHADAVLAVFERWSVADPDTIAPCLAEMENAREAMAWAQVADLATAARLGAAASGPTSFSVWRHEVTQWLLALEPAMDAAPGRALPAALQAGWWVALARALIMRRDPRAAAVAERAHAQCDRLASPQRAFESAVAWVRAHLAAGADLDRACTALEARLAALPAPTIRDRVQVEGALAIAARLRGDDGAVLDHRSRTLALAREAGLTGWADAAESNVVSSLNTLGRSAEAAERGAALLARIRARDPEGRDGNLPWVYAGLIHALAVLGRVDAARALVADARAVSERLAEPILLPVLARLAAAEGRLEDAALLVGHARARYDRAGLVPERDDERILAHATDAAVAELGADRVAALVGDGRGLGDAEAAALPSVSPPSSPSPSPPRAGAHAPRR